jgi:hypothetical protein
MRYTLFSGCSYTAGTGFELEKDEPNLWVNQMHKMFFSDTTLLNVSKGGRSNAGIFQDTIRALTSYPVDFAVVQWTSMPRYELDLGFELYSTRQCFIPNTPCFDHNLNDINYTSSYLESIRDRFTSLAHDCHEILNLVEYVNSIVNLSRLTKTKVVFINGLCPWDTEFFTRNASLRPVGYTEYTRKIINAETRPDSENFELYNQMHDNFTEAGGIHESLWVNLNNSMLTTISDVNSDNLHPGINSNNYYFDLFSKDLITKQLI